MALTSHLSVEEVRKVPSTGNIRPRRIVSDVSISLEPGVEYICSFGNDDSLGVWLGIGVRFWCGC
jgi:hypothetical protein